MKAEFNNTVDILVKAYMNDELEHGACEMCVVGNLVYAAGHPRYNFNKMGLDSCGMWKNVFCTDPDLKEQYYGSFEENGDYYLIGLKMIEDTGYTVQELARVEYAFETAPLGNSNDEWMFNGLMSVVDVLAEIHNVDLSQKELAKLLFVK